MLHSDLLLNADMEMAMLSAEDRDQRVRSFASLRMTNVESEQGNCVRDETVL